MICRSVIKISFSLLPSSSKKNMKLSCGKNSTPFSLFSKYQNLTRAHIKSICIKKPPYLWLDLTISLFSPNFHCNLIVLRKLELQVMTSSRKNSILRPFVTISSVLVCPISPITNDKELFSMRTHHSASLRCVSLSQHSSTRTSLQKLTFNTQKEFTENSLVICSWVNWNKSQQLYVQSSRFVVKVSSKQPRRCLIGQQSTVMVFSTGNNYSEDKSCNSVSTYLSTSQKP